MRVYISADIEGTTGITDWEEARKVHPTYGEFREEMTAEVLAACEGAMEAGAREITIKDAHASGRNIIASRLPACARLIRGWSGHPFCMVQELDESYDAALFVGYHSKAGTDDNPLAHTLTLKIGHIKLNETIASEFLIHAYAASLVGVPVVFVSGDKGICADVAKVNGAITTVAVSEGRGPSTIGPVPSRTLGAIREAARKALGGDLSACRLALPPHFVLEVKYVNPVDAYRASWYPGAAHAAPQTLRFESDSYFEILRALRFVT
jgi:D-amino peptidase